MANAFDALNQGFSTAGNMLDTFAQQRAGNALAGGDYTSAAKQLYQSGQLDLGSQVQNVGDAHHRQEQADRLMFLGKAAQSLASIPDDPNHTARRAALNSLVPTFKAMGMDDATIQAAQQSDLSDPALAAFGAQVGKALQIIQNSHGIYGVTGTGQLRTLKEFPQAPIGLDPQKNYYVPDTGDTSGGTPSQQAASAATATPAATPSADQVFQNIIQQESGGKPGVLGQPTKYGQAQGETQLLPSTAKAMAAKLGVPWRPDLMTGTTPEAQAYQLKLGRAYFDEGLAANNGDVAKAAAYYYGGPNPALHGPKTQAYVQAVTGGAAGGTPTLQGGQAGDTAPPQIPGYKLVQPAQPSAEDTPLTPAAIDANAVRYVMTGQMPPMGMGKAARTDRVKILNRGAELAKQWNIKPEDWVTGMAQFKVTQGSLQQTSKTLAVLQPSEQAVNSNLQLALSLAPKGGGGTNIPVFNRWLMAGRKATGDADVTKFQQALQTVAVEYGKVISTTSGGGNQALSDDARRDAYNRLNSAQTIDQLRGRLEIIQREMENKVNAFRDEQAALTSQLRNGMMGNSQPTSIPGGRPPLSSFQR